MAKKTFPLVAIQIKKETEVSRKLTNFVLLMYKQLTREQRYAIYLGLQEKKTYTAIARQIWLFSLPYS